MAWHVLEKLQSKRKIGEVLLELGIITQESLEAALRKSSQTKARLGQVLIQDGYISDTQLAAALASQFNMEFLDLEGLTPSPDAIQLIPENTARQQMVLPLSLDSQAQSLTLAVFDPLNILNIQTISRITKMELIVKVAPESQLRSAIDKAYSRGDGFDRIVKQLANNAEVAKKPAATQNTSSVLDITNRDAASIENLVNKILERSVSERASDIHIEPDEKVVRVRHRIDGVLIEASTIPLELYSAVVSRLKILGALDIAEKRNPQDGRFRMNTPGKVVDLRMSTLPTVRGEKIVLRILDKSALSVRLDDIGLSPQNLERATHALDAPFGIIFVTGPTGSGKSTTVYSMLNHLNNIERNIITVEDPVEYQFNLINQVQVQPKIGLTFATVLRSILRQDPDVIMVGEIRDKETAEIAIRAALTGHLVITTLHTNNAVSTISRLVDMGVDPVLIASSLIGVVSQRLVRVLCKECKKKAKPDEVELLQLASKSLIREHEIYAPAGCAKCNNLGYKGRTPILEFLALDSELRKAILTHAGAEELLEIAKRRQFTTMRDDGVEKILRGITTPAEVLRATLSGD